MDQVNEPKETPQPNLTKARITTIILEDILFRSPFYGVAVLLLLGGISFSCVWFVLNILRPYVMGQ